MNIGEYSCNNPILLHVKIIGKKIQGYIARLFSIEINRKIYITI
jgi:hypothetical protein